MAAYLEPIRQALFIFPSAALLLLLPYMLWSYRKYGSVISLRIVIVYSFILYMISVYCLVILPLPTDQKIAAIAGHHDMQLIPFSFVAEIIKHGTFHITRPSSYLSLLNDNTFLTTLFNLFMTLPFGMYLRYFFKCSLKRTVCLSFFLSLFFELTQLSGLYFIYPGSYRLFDVDDLIINTLGGTLGYFAIRPFLGVLPSQAELDRRSFRLGAQVSLVRRLFAFFADCLCLAVLSLPGEALLGLLRVPASWRVPVLLLAYFGLLPLALHGQTFGKRLMKIRIVSTADGPVRWYQYPLRTAPLFAVLVLLPQLISALLSAATASHALIQGAALILRGLVSACYAFYLLFAGIMMAMHKPLFYERLSRTQLVSTLPVREPPDGKTP